MREYFPLRSGFLTDIVSRDRIFYSEPMSRHTSFHVGGPAEVLVMPRTEAELVSAVRQLAAQRIPFEVIGHGTNLLVSDTGLPGVTIVLNEGYLELHENGMIRVGAGMLLRRLYEEAVQLGFTGLEFAAGIPGTLGGAVAMNAGAYGRELKDVVRSVRVLDYMGKITSVPCAWMQFGYRTSIVQKRPMIVLSADLELPRGDVEQSRREAASLRERRRRSQPLDLPSAGSTFKRPEGAFAGTLIQTCGLKGARIGGAMVSPRHAGFIVNADHASARDIYRLIREVRRTVYSCTGIVLEPEVKFLGDFNV